MISGAEIAKFPHNGRIWSLAIDSDGQRFATGSDDTARMLSLRTGEQLVAVRSVYGPINALAITPDGSRLVTGSNAGPARIWDSRSGHEIAPLIGVKDVIDSVAVTPDGQYAGSLDCSAVT